MPRYTPSDEEMDDTYAGSAPVTKPTEAEKPSVDEENTESSTALVPNKILSPDGEPLKEGEEIVVRVVRNHGDQSEIEYAPKEGATEEPSETEGEMTPGNEEAEIAALDEKA